MTESMEKGILTNILSVQRYTLVHRLNLQYVPTTIAPRESDGGNKLSVDRMHIMCGPGFDDRVSDQGFR